MRPRYDMHICMCNILCVSLLFSFKVSLCTHRVHTSLVLHNSPQCLTEQISIRESILCVWNILIFFSGSQWKVRFFESQYKKNQMKGFPSAPMIISSSLMHCQIFRIVHSECKIKLKTPTWCLFLFCFYSFFFFTLLSHTRDWVVEIKSICLR